MGKKIQNIGRYVMDGVALGKGNFARVELATHGVTHAKVAIKVMDTRKIKEEYVRTNLHREACILGQLRHPNIVRLYETLKATTLYCLVMEYASGGDLLTYIKSQEGSRLRESAARPYIRQLTSTLHYLHERGVVHRDLKMENIMLDQKKKNIKLIDFGLSNVYKEKRLLRTHCGSPEYAAPELFVMGRSYGPEIDVWSMGIIAYAMMMGQLPFSTPFNDEYMRQRMLLQIQKGLGSVHDKIMAVLSADCRSMLHQLIEPKPELRIPLLELELHPWLTSSGRLPFIPYHAPPRSKQLRGEIVSELAELMQQKRLVVEETVKESRADELSAMYNMLLDVRRQKLGVFEVDHTLCVKALRGEMPHIPDRPRLLRRVYKRPMSNRNAPIKSSRGGLGGEAAGRMTMADVVMPTLMMAESVRHDASTPHVPPGAEPAPGPDGGQRCEQAMDMLSIPTIDGAGVSLSVQHQQPKPRRAPAAKLNLTLDLSHPNLALRNWRPPHGAAALRRTGALEQQNSQMGLAASSGVPPRLSPSVQFADRPADRPRSPAGATTPRPRAKRPSYLCYRRPSEPDRSTGAIPKRYGVANGYRTVAPKATPENSVIGSCYSSDADDDGDDDDDDGVCVGDAPPAKLTSVDDCGLPCGGVASGDSRSLPASSCRLQVVAPPGGHALDLFRSPADERRSFGGDGGDGDDDSRFLFPHVGSRTPVPTPGGSTEVGPRRSLSVDDVADAAMTGETAAWDGGGGGAGHNADRSDVSLSVLTRQSPATLTAVISLDDHFSELTATPAAVHYQCPAHVVTATGGTTRYDHNDSSTTDVDVGSDSTPHHSPTCTRGKKPKKRTQKDIQWRSLWQRGVTTLLRRSRPTSDISVHTARYANGTTADVPNSKGNGSTMAARPPGSQSEAAAVERTDSPVVSDSSFPDKWPSSAPQLRWPIDRHSAGDRLLSGHSSTTAAGHYLAGQSASEHSITGRSIGSNSAGSEDLLTGRSGEWIECRPLGVDRRPVNNPASDVTTVRIKSCDTNSNTMPVIVNGQVICHSGGVSEMFNNNSAARLSSRDHNTRPHRLSRV